MKAILVWFICLISSMTFYSTQTSWNSVNRRYVQVKKRIDLESWSCFSPWSENRQNTRTNELNQLFRDDILAPLFWLPEQKNNQNGNFGKKPNREFTLQKLLHSIGASTVFCNAKYRREEQIEKTKQGEKKPQPKNNSNTSGNYSFTIQTTFL